MPFTPGHRPNTRIVRGWFDLQAEGESWGLTHSVVETTIDWAVSAIGYYLDQPHPTAIPPQMLEFFATRLRGLDGSMSIVV